MFRLQVPKEAALPVRYRQPPFDRLECESCSCAYSVRLSDISALEQIREESELSVRRIPPFQICNQAKQQTTQTLFQSVCQLSHRHFFRQLDFIAGQVQRNTAECAAVNNSLPPAHIYSLYC